MSKSYLTIAAAALAMTFAACSSDDLALNNDQQKAPQLEEGAVGFDVYTQKATTRGGVPGSVTTDVLKGAGNAVGPGFGVFGYYTDNNEYDQRSTPNFFYNQLVKAKFASAASDATFESWEYSPIRYWPNEYGNKAESDDNDKVTYFAYAPYVDVVPSSGKLKETADGEETWGITSMTRNTAQGDPIIKYIASFWKEKSVDLCWGVVDEASATTWDLAQTGTKQDNIAAGKPWLNIQRPANTNQRVKFNFKHALAQMQVNIDADVDIDGRGHDNPVEKKTRVWVRQVKFNGFALKGALNLNNGDADQPKWLDYAGQEDIVSEEIIVYDGRKEGKEGVAGSVATNEKVTGLNPTLVQDGIYKPVSGDDVYDSNVELVVNGVNQKGEAQTGVVDYQRTGVTKTAVPLFCQNGENKNSKAADGGVFHVIPTGDALEIEIVYDIETVDANLAQNLSDGATKGSSIENRISKKITFGTDVNNDKLQAGHSYVLNLHLGMNSVKFDAYVSDWITEPKQDVDLPLNVPAFAAVANPTSATAIPVTIPFKGDYTFAITGMNGGESFGAIANTAVTPQTDVKWAFTNKNANTSGVAIQTVTPAVNPTTSDRTQEVTWKGNQSSTGVKLAITQKAHPLFMQITGFANVSTDGTITLTRYNDETYMSSSDWTTNGTDPVTNGWFTGASPSIQVWRNGVKVTPKAAFTDAGTSHNNTITIDDELQAGDVIKVTLKTGDAPEETVTATVGGIYYPISKKQIVYREPGTTENVKPEYEGKNQSLSITYVSSDATVAANPTSGELTTLKAGKTTITATLAAAGLDVEGTASFELTVIKQDSKFDASFVDVTVPKTTTQLDDGNKLIWDFSSIKVIGDKDSGHELSGTLSLNIDKVTDGSGNVIVSAPFNLGASKKIYTTSAISEGTYIIYVKGTHTGEDNKYNGCEQTIKVTLTVTTA